MISQFIKSIFKNSQNGTRILPPEALLVDQRTALLSEIFRNSKVSQGSFDLLYRPAIDAMAEYVQLLPGSESHHHAYPGGLLDHVLESVNYALRIRSGIQLPIDQPPEVIRIKTDIYTYAVFCAALLHDVGKPVVDMEIMLLNQKGQSLGEWNPYSGSINQSNASRYTFRYRKKRLYKLHNLVAPVMMTKIIPADGLGWIASDQALYVELLEYIQGTKSNSAIANIVQKADQTSVSKALGANVTTIDGAGSKTTLSLDDKILIALKAITSRHQQSFNQKGSMAWFDGEFCWFVCKRLVDEIKEQFRSDGVTGLPSDNIRIYDVMVESGLVVSNQGKAIWRAAIETKDWKPGELTLLKIHHTQLWDGDPGIEKFNGTIHAGTETVTPDTPQAGNSTQDVASALDNMINLATAKPKPDDAREAKDDKEEGEGSDLSAIFITDNAYDSTASIENREKQQITASESDLKQHPARLDNFEGECNPGTAFLFWLKDGIKDKSIRYNGSEYPVHILPDNQIFLVSPLIFKKYGESTKQNWQTIQKSFQKLRINKKNAKGENWHKVRVNGERTTTTLKGWIIPVDEVMTSGSKPKVNAHLTLLG